MTSFFKAPQVPEALPGLESLSRQAPRRGPLWPRPPVHTHLSRSCFLVRLWALSAFSSACRLRSSAQNLVLWVLCRAVSRLQQALGDQLLLVRLSRDLVCGTLQGEAVLSSRPAHGGPSEAPKLANTFPSLWDTLSVSTYQNTEQTHLVSDTSNRYQYIM